MSVRPPDEAEWHDPNWADATSGGLTGRWTSGLQVLYGHGSNRPTANTASVAQNYGWTTIPAVDGMDNPRLAGFGERCQTNHYPSAQTCAEMCKSSGSWEVSAIEPQGTPVWNYPIQMFTQAVQAGTNAVMWTQLGKRPLRNMMSGGDGGSNSEDPNYPSCSGCGQPNDDAPMCRDAKYWSNVMPNSGPVTTSCLYSGTNKADPSRDSRDKYGFQNSHRRGAGDYIIGHCVSQPEMAQTINYTCVTKPWGPWSMGIWQGAGLENRAAGGVGYGNCHCCPPPTGQQIGPPGCAQVLQNDYTKSAYMDPIFGTYQGMPFESNMHCKSPPISPNGDTWCSANCLNVTFGWSGPGDNANWPYLAAPFCAHFPAKGVASTRMAFAVIRADHRKYDNASPANRLTPPGKCGNYSAEAPYANDPSQFFPCAPNAGGLTSEATARQSTMMLHIWGSLWDPCPPWPRVCDCTMKLPIDESNEACTVPYDSAEDFLLPPNHMYASPCDSDFGSYHPEGTAGPEEGTAIPFYPQWTRTPTSTSRSARKGHWSGTTWVQESPAANEPTVAATRYCPDCETYQQQFYREGAQVTPGE